MINKFYNYLFTIILFFNIILITKNQYASEILLYADDISYDKDENIIARGNAKVISDNKIITSDLIIYSKKNDNIILPIDFKLKDKGNNYYYGSSGSAKKNLDYWIINDVKVLLNDGSRIVGKKIKRNKNIDIITKGVYSPCESKIKIANFLCPIWQLEGEKMLHDYDNLFLYQKHSKMRIFNLPVFYSPYLVTPSPLRKDRKSGFLTPSLNLNFFDTQISQSTSFPYYFNISEDKELTFTPTINYGGGVDSSQRFNFDYNQIISGGSLSSKLTLDSTLENQNNDKWLKDGSLISSLKKNINENFNLNFKSELQTSKNYIQQTNPNNELSYASSLITSLDINGYYLRNIDDRLRLTLSTYQSNQDNEDNKTIPTILPFATYDTGKSYYKSYDYKNIIEFYSIFRDTPTDIHSKSQKKLSSNFIINSEKIKFNSLVTFKSSFYNQLFDVEDKKIENKYIGSHYFRSFPILGIYAETPLKLKSNFKDLTYTPKISLILSPGLSNTNRISNEDSSVNSYTIDNNVLLNRYTGSDQLDNSKRINFEFNTRNDKFNSSLLQTYEFTNNSNYHNSQGNEENLSDLLGNLTLQNINYETSYDFRYDHQKNLIKSQNLALNYFSALGKLELNYLDQKIDNDNETLNYTFTTKKINKYSKISYFGLYDLNEEINKENGIAYSYFDECFGVNIDLKRNSYTEGNLKPQDILTVMFSFKNVGSYKSTNLAVSETDKQDIQWEGFSVNNELFN